MILPDVNILLYAHDELSPFHRAAAGWFRTVLSADQVFFSWQTITGFLRISTNPKLLANPLTIDRAVDIVNSWLEHENTYIVNFEKKDWPHFAEVLIEGQSSGALVMDAHLAALAASCGATVASTDRDFTRFEGINFVNPISKK